MKIGIKLSILIKTGAIILLLLSLMTGCQEPYEDTTPAGERDALSAHDALVGLVQKVTMLDGSADNALDGMSCTSVIYPVTIERRDQLEQLTGVEDLAQLLEDSIEFELHFPIQLMLADYTEVTILDDDELEDLQEACEEGGTDPDIECIDFMYPITLASFDTLTEVTSIETLASDSHAFRYFASLESKLISFEWPITLITSDQTLTFDAHSTLEAGILQHANSCDEGDFVPEFDFEDDDDERIEDHPLYQTLTKAAWTVSAFTVEDESFTSEFDGLVMEFEQDWSLAAIFESTDLDGEWELELDLELIVALELATDDEFLVLLNDEWIVSEYSASEVIATSESGEKRLVLIAN